MAERGNNIGCNFTCAFFRHPLIVIGNRRCRMNEAKFRGYDYNIEIAAGRVADKLLQHPVKLAVITINRREQARSRVLALTAT